MEQVDHLVYDEDIDVDDIEQINYYDNDLKRSIEFYNYFKVFLLVVNFVFAIFYSNMDQTNMYYLLISIYMFDCLTYDNIIMYINGSINNVIFKFVFIIYLVVECISTLYVISTIDSIYRNSFLSIYFETRLFIWLFFLIVMAVGIYNCYLIDYFNESVIDKYSHYKFFENHIIDSDRKIVKCLDNDHNLCHICLHNYEKNVSITLLNCGHHFDRGCCEKWIITKNTCPCCRSFIDL